MWLACPLRRSRTLFELRERSTLLTVEERRLTAFRNASNVVRIVSPEWRAWLRLGGGGKSVPPSPTQLKISASAQRNRTWAAERQSVRTGAPKRDSEGHGRAPGWHSLSEPFFERKAGRLAW